MGKSKKIRRLEKAAQMGDPGAMCRLATEYFSGVNVKANMEKAKYWFALSVEGGFSVAQEWLDKCNFDG